MSSIGNMFETIKNAKKLSGHIKDLQTDLESKTVVGAAGAGMVEATLNGTGELLGIKFAPGTITPDDPEMLADLIVAAVADARRKSAVIRAEALRKMSGGVDLSAFGIEIPNFI